MATTPTSSSGRSLTLIIVLAVSLTLNAVTLVALPVLHFFHHAHHPEMAGGPHDFAPGEREHHHMGFGGPGGPRFGWGGTPPIPEEMSQHMLDFLSNKLSLTDDEKTKIKPILLQQATDIEKQIEAQKAAMQQSKDQVDTQIRALLTPDQQKQLDALKAEMEAHHPDHS